MARTPDTQPERDNENSRTERQGAERERQYGRDGGLLGAAYRRWLRPLVTSELHRQRLKLTYDLWAYRGLLRVPALSFGQSVRLISRLLRIDWSILHDHKPCEIAPILVDLMRRPASPGEIVIEAGCWNGGSAAKFSIVCKMFGYRLHLYDSFQGVREWGFAYRAQQSAVTQNIREYGDEGVCAVHPGWFKDTLWNRPVPFPVRLAYIDCDVPAGTRQVLSAVVPSLARDGVVYTQDYHIRNVRQVLHDGATWMELGVKSPTIRYVVRNLAQLTFSKC
jgi:Macrocin-O-methyltransferase (TylF)